MARSGGLRIRKRLNARRSVGEQRRQALKKGRRKFNRAEQSLRDMGFYIPAQPGQIIEG